MFGITIGLQSLSQLKKRYKDSWEIVLDCCDTILFLGSSSRETLEYIVTLLGKKTWYKKSTGRTFSRQGSTSVNWDVVGRELATLEEILGMEKDHCILFIATVGAFYSKLYELEQHPYYKDLYEPWTKSGKKYNHYIELKCQENEDYRLLCDLGLEFATLIETPKIEEVDEEEIEYILKTGIVKLEDLRV